MLNIGKTSSKPSQVDHILEVALIFSIMLVYTLLEVFHKSDTRHHGTDRNIVDTEFNAHQYD